MPNSTDQRPRGITALAIFFTAGAFISATSCASLLSPGSPLELMWRLNPRARGAFVSMGSLGPILLGVVSAACALAAPGLLRGRSWGYWLAVGLLSVNLLGDVVNVGLGTEPRALAGVPIVTAVLVFLATERVRRFFRRGAGLWGSR